MLFLRRCGYFEREAKGKVIQFVASEENEGKLFSKEEPRGTFYVSL